MQYCWFPGLVLFMAHVMSVNVAVNPGCECIVYQSFGKSQGIFHSPNFPAFYSRGIDCILFTFIADVEEIIEINFIEFDLKWRGRITGCGDYLRLFVNLDRPEVNEHSRHDYELCGNISNLDQKTYYSKGRSLVMEFHSDSSHVNHTGFKGLFKFLERRNFVTCGDKESGTMCSYTFQSRDNNNCRTFFSPRYPQNYPELSNCQYIFFGQSGERVKIKFQIIQLHNNDNLCAQSKDFITVYDGKDLNSPLVNQYCGVQNNIEFISSGPYLYIEFHSDNKFQQKGFAATYSFLPKGYQSTTTIGMTGDSSTFVNCNEFISSSMKTQDTISSQNFPNGPYPSSMTCRYVFQGQKNERIQIVFTDMNLVYSGGDPDKPHDCAEQDSITVILRYGTEEKDTWTYCGRKMPPNLMSNGPWMKIVFNSVLSSPKSIGSGFRFKYNIRKDFGITTGEQDPSGICSFNFHSSNAQTGNFTSPNYLGYYPRNTECQYTFYGQKSENVIIGFKEFDVEGVIPSCSKDQKSDFVEFSNFQGTEDRNMKNRCGKEPPPEVRSDGAFFRVTFKSDGNYDGRGFLGQYKFVQDVQSSTTIHPPSSAVESSTNLYIILGLYIINLLICCLL